MYSTLISLTLIASSNPATPNTSHLDALRQRLGFVEVATYWLEYETRYFDITKADAESAKEHYALTKEICHVTGVTDDGVTVAFSGVELPPCLMNIEQAQVLLNSERLDVSWPHFRLETWEGPGKRQEWSTSRVHDETGLTVWETVDGIPGIASRLAISSVWDAEAGAVTLFGRLFRQLSILLDEADRLDGVQEEADGFDALVSMLDFELLERFDDMYLPNGIMVTPGHCEISYRDHGATSSLSMRFFDCLDEPLVDQVIRWSAHSPFPTAFEERWWVPGAGNLVRQQSVTVLRDPNGEPVEKLVRWRGAPGQRVYDERFGPEQVYLAGDLDTSDLALAVRADAERVQARDVEGPPAPARVEVLSGGEHFRIHEDRLPGHVLEGTTHRFELSIENASEVMRSFGLLTPSCGVVGVGFDYQDVLGNQTLPLRVDVQASQPGWNVYTLELPYFGFDERENGMLRLRLSVFAEDVGAMEPRVQGPLRWHAGEPLPEARCTWLPGLGYDAAPSFEASPAGARWRETIREDGVTLELVGLPEFGDRYGVLPLRLCLRGHDLAVLAQEALVLVDRVPPGLEERWPSCVRTLAGSFPRRDHLEIPGVEILSAELSNDGDDPAGRTQVDLVIEGGRLTIVEPRPSGVSSRLATYGVRLGTDLGRVDVFVYSGPAATEILH